MGACTERTQIKQYLQYKSELQGSRLLCFPAALYVIHFLQIIWQGDERMERLLSNGVESFEVLRERGAIYVDKTQYIYNLSRQIIPFFYSAPRRFGKSLLIQTMKAFWEGKRDLFRGLAIERLMGAEEWKQYPVFCFNFSKGYFDEVSALEEKLTEQLVLWERIYGDEYSGFSLSGRFEQLLRKAHEQTGLRCVVLIDEYDKPLLDHLDNDGLSDHFRSVFKGFFSILKSSSEDIHYVFITGVTKFNKISIFSDLNNLTDISLNPEYSALCGFTQEEILTYYGPEIQKLADANGMTQEQCLEKLKSTYDGYRFSYRGEKVYNPYDVLGSFFAGEFDYFWFETGTPTFLVNEIRKRHYSFYKVNSRLNHERIRMRRIDLKNYRHGYGDITPLLFQTGYLTIADFDLDAQEYLMDFPNDEVRYAFTRNLLPAVIPEDTQSGIDMDDLYFAAEDGMLDDMKKIIQNLFAVIPYPAQEKQSQVFEYNFQSVLFIAFTLMGNRCQCEYHTFTGRIDCNIQTRRFIYLFEFKCDKTAQEALQQIETNQYELAFVADPRKLYKIGVNFSSETRNMDGWEVVER